jgi:hypothetical protein|tara:strand:+ start:752 stop:1111 length:360 start_codon:yes stop_codon:yes gene_type:complete
MSHIDWTHSPDDTAESWTHSAVVLPSAQKNESWSIESLYGFESWGAEDDYNWDLQTENWDVWGDIGAGVWTHSAVVLPSAQKNESWAHAVGSVAEDWILLDYWVDNSELWNEEDLVWHH